MRIFSTPNSICQRKITLAALLETLAAAAISIAIAIHYGTIAHIAIGACLAPISLMRSESSVTKAREWFRALFAKAWPLKKRIILLYIAIWSPFIRIAAPLRYPLAGIKNIPSNWFRVVFNEDVRTNAEMIPGLEVPLHSITQLNYLHRPDVIISTVSAFAMLLIWHWNITRLPSDAPEIMFYLFYAFFVLYLFLCLLHLATPLPLYMYSR